ncbi:MAG: carbohydrate-binding family 9-like protein [Sphingobacterium composti]|uniref:carbohydrate-binding family 9-like protein n=1 Tax=Sphingobacterium composti TaxID=363260 RepID=UPI0013595AEE|nr:carbohydrate-binding family 9-like protein [Sphingobacterium composti Ten et al. 2007 non Yoo et al. 2007]
MNTVQVCKIHIPFINAESLRFAFKELNWHKINNSPWGAEYPYTPDVQFQIAYDDEHIFLHYDVKEEFVKATYIRPNENVWEDSCVEFFLSLDNKQTYYNFEFNVLGTGLIGYGPAIKSERHRLSATKIEQVDAFVQLKKVSGNKEWEIYLIIPITIFGDVSFEGKTYHANFYKCGDGLPQPHFLAWNNIELPKPNFHRPDFFGEISFN